MNSPEQECAVINEHLGDEEALLWSGSPEKKIFISELIAKELPLGLALVVITYFLTLLFTRGVVRRDIVMVFMLVTVSVLYILKNVSYYHRVKQTEMKAVFGVTSERVLSCREGRDVREMPVDDRLDWKRKPSSIRFFHPTKAVNWSIWGLEDPREPEEAVRKALAGSGDDGW